MSEPTYTQFTERMYARLPEVMREADKLNDYTLKRYISAMGDVEDQVERLIARLTYLTKQERLGLENLNDDYSYYDLDWRYFQATDSRNSAVIASEGAPAFLRTLQAYRVVPNTTLSVGAVYRTDNQSVDNTFGLRIWYYNASMELMAFKDVVRLNGSFGPQWVIRNAVDVVPDEAYYVRISPFANNSSGVASRVWVDDVYARSNYEVTTTNNLVTSDHNFILRAEDEMVEQGDFDLALEAQWEADRLRAEAERLRDEAPNFFRDGDFEGDNPHGVILSTENARSGTNSWLALESGALVSDMRPEIVEDVIAVTPGELWRFSFYYRTRSTDTERVNGGLRLQAREDVDAGAWRMANESAGLANIGTNRSPDGWTLISGEYVVEEDIGALRPRIAFAPGSSDTDVYIDDISFVNLTPDPDLEARIVEAQAHADLTAWDLGPDVELADHALSLVPDIQSYRTWLNLDSDSAEPGYARQLIDDVQPNGTYTISALIVKDGNVPADAEVRVTVTPDTGGPTVETFTMEGYETNIPSLVSFVWNAPEQVSTAIVNIEYVVDGTSAQGLRINDVSMTRYNPALAQMAREGDPTTLNVREKAHQELLAATQPRQEGWTRYETGGDPEEPLEPSQDDPASGTSFIDDQWHYTRPNNTYTFKGQYLSDDPQAYADLIIWYRIEGKGWGESMLHRITPSTMGIWTNFERTIVIPDSATEFKVNFDVYRTNSSSVFDLRNFSMMSPEDRDWYMAGSRPFAINAMTTRSLNFLNRNDLVHYTADLMVTGVPGGGSYGIRIYSGDNQVLHEKLVRTTKRNEVVSITGAFQIPGSLLDLRAVLYVNDPTPKHQAAYFLSNLDIVHSIQRYVEEPQNLIRNGGYEFPNALENWELLAEREQVRKNYEADPSFETHVPAPYNSALTTEAAVSPIYHGSRSVKITNPGGNYTRLGINLGDMSRFMGEGHVAIHVYIPSSSNVTVTGYRYQDTGSHRVVYLDDLPKDKWIALEVVKPIGGPSLHNWIAIETRPLEAGAVVYMDAVSISDGPGGYFDSSFTDTPLVRYTWDETEQVHIEHRKDYYRPVGQSMAVSTGIGYNREDVPERPDDVPLGSTSDLVDPRTANTEWLPWLAQFAGQNINDFATMDDARTTMASGSNFAAGTIDAISAAVATVLSGTRTVRVFPHTTDLTKRGQATEWDVSIVTRTSESPDISVMEEAVIKRNAKPAGVVFHFHKHQSTWDAVELANPTWNIWDTRDWTGIEEAGLEGT